MARIDAGFTLIEILTALVVLAIVGISAQLAIAQYTEVQIHLKNKRQAHWVAWNGAMEVYRKAHWPESVKLEDVLVEGTGKALGRSWSLSTVQTPTLDNRLVRAEVSAQDSQDNSIEAFVVMYTLR